MQGEFKARRWWQTKWFVLGVIVVVLIGGGVSTAAVIVHRRNERRAAATLAASLQSQLTNVVYGTHSDAATIQLANALINGVQAKHFTIKSAQLAQIYLDRANANSNLGKFPAALDDYKRAIATDAGAKIGALQGELAVQSQLNHTAALAPILEQLIPLLRKSEMPLAGSEAAQYQAALEQLKSGQKVAF